ncbi:hypothetical protein AAFF_G00372310 [Aldrovandia affinis]|uniref:C1q domain-containing protein n=1 Tax=Aldrovandia affinis TaxID=143900 RepID=A0AAD7WM04_9TELE|nr:hypothetical protein AAFF_G00372310 [Aldrovandia affinis]
MTVPDPSAGLLTWPALPALPRPRDAPSLMTERPPRRWQSRVHRSDVGHAYLRQLRRAAPTAGVELNLRMALLNTRSLANKTFLLNDFFTSRDLDFMFLTETWLHAGFKATEMTCAPYLLALGLYLVLSCQVSAAEDSLGSPFILSALEDAKRIVDEAYKYSREESLSRVQKMSASPSDLLRLLKQPARDTRSVVRAADYMENTLRLIEERTHHLHKRSLNATDLITPDELSTIARLTGCAARVQPPSCRTTPQVNKYRTATSICNNRRYPRRGTSNTPFSRWLPAEYEDGISQPKGWDPKKRYNGFLLPLVREVSNRILNSANEYVESDQLYTHLVTIFGQWNDHDLTFTPHSPSIRSFSNGINCDESCEQTNPCFPIQIPSGDPRFGTKSKNCLPFFRSAPACGTGNTGFIFGANNVRQQINSLTAFQDVGQVYGSEDVQARELRNLTNDEGLLRINQRFTDKGRELLPFATMEPSVCATRQGITNTPGLAEVPCFVAGDARANENIGLTSLHTLFLREHNRLARALRQLNPHWSSETLYQEARKIMGGYHQVITFRDYLQHIVGPETVARQLSTYPGYDETVDPSIANVFATAAYRLGHLAIQPFMFRLDENYNEHPQFPNVMLHKAFFTPWRLVFEGGIDPVIRGLVGCPAKLNTQDHMMVEALRDKLFQFTSKLALDLGALNMQRSHDHGIPGYNAWRRFCGLPEPQTVEQLAEVLNNTDLAQRLLQLYGSPANIDMWLAGISEPFVPGGRVGPLFACLIATQFQKIRQGDRLWWQNEGVFTGRQRASLANVSLARIICDNTGIKDVPSEPFLFRPRGTAYTHCDAIPAFDLTPWIDAGPGIQRSAFAVRLGYNYPNPNQVIVFREVIYNGQNHYNKQTGVFTCVVPGVYQFDFFCTLFQNVGNIDLLRNNKVVLHSFTTLQKGYINSSGGTVLELQEGDEVCLQANYGGNAMTSDSLFSGHLLFTV